MECDKCAEDLTAYLDGELSDTRAGQLESHLQACQVCAGEYQGLKESVVFIESHVREIVPSAEIWNGLRSRIATIETPFPANGWFQLLTVNRWRTATATFAATAVLALGLWGYVHHETFQSEGEIQRFMSSYVQERDAQEQVHSVSAAASLSTISDSDAATDLSVDSFHSKFENNPFVVLESDSFSNPFRSEDR